jgi:hypothetical protein
MSGAPALAELRLAAAIVHAVPQSVLTLASPCGRSVCVGFRLDDGVSMTPCALRRAVALAKGDASALAHILGLSGVPLRAWFVGDEMEERRVGLGVYRHDCTEDRGFVFATLLPPDAVEHALRAAMAEVQAGGGVEAEALASGCVRVAHDPELEATVVLVGYGRDGEPPPGAEGLALRFAASCAVQELVETLAHP